MDQDLVYTKTQAGEDAVRQRTRVVQRNQRLLLVQVDGKTPVSELAAKIGSARLVEDALKELENGGYVVPLPQAVSVWERGKRAAKDLESVISRFSAFAPKAPVAPEAQGKSPESAMPAGFSAFGKPILAESGFSPPPAALPEPDVPSRKIRPRRRLGWRPMLLGLLLLLGLAAFLFPYDHFKPRFETALQGVFHTRVRIGSVALEVLPRPALTLGAIEIGSGSEMSIRKIRLPLTWSLLTGDLRSLPEAHVSGIAAPLGAMAFLLQPGFDAGGGRVIRRTLFQGLVLRTKDAALPVMEGEILSAADGGLEKLQLRTADRTLQIAALPVAQGLQLAVEGFGWRPLPDEPYVFDSLQAKGLLQAGKLVLNDIDGGVMGGVLKGSWLLDWGNGMAMAGEASLTRLDLGRVTQAFAPSLKLEGELDGHLNLRARGSDWQGMWANVEASLDANATRGAAHGIDIGEAARRGAGQGASGGVTKFDSLRGRLDLGPQHVGSDDLRLEAGLIAARGRFVSDRTGRVDGAFDVNIKGSAGGIRMPIRISGTLPNLVATAGR